MDKVVIKKTGSNYAADKELRLRNVPKSTIQEVKNVAAHVGLTAGEFLKGKIIDIMIMYPEHYRKPMPKD